MLAAATRVLFEAGVKAVLLLWDKANSKIALKATAKGDKNGFAVSFTDKHSGSIRAKSFVVHIGWTGTSREMLPAAWNEKEKMLEAAVPPEHTGSERMADTRRKTKTGL